MRLSNAQKEILRVLFEITTRETSVCPIGAIALFMQLNQRRERPIAVTHFRRCCQKLISCRLIEHCRDPLTLKLALRLTASGMTYALSLYDTPQGEA